MSKKLQKSIQDYISKIKKPTSNVQFNSTSFSPSKQWILKGCKHTKTLSFTINGDGNGGRSSEDNGDAATLSDVDRFLFENFKSLYMKDDDNEEETNGRRGRVREIDEEKSPRGVLFDSPRFVDPPPDLRRSNRFFVATCLSSSLIEEARSSGVTTDTTLSTSGDMGSTSISTSTNSTSANYPDKFDEENSSGGGGGGSGHDMNSHNIPKDFIPVLTYSPNPYNDFRRSMQEMVEARLKHYQNIEWDFMEELLFCYLNLNDKKSYKYILNAFVDLTVVLRQNHGKIPASSEVARRDKRSRRTRHSNNNYNNNDVT